MAPKIYLGKTNEITEIIKIKSLWENDMYPESWTHIYELS